MLVFTVLYSRVSMYFMYAKVCMMTVHAAHYQPTFHVLVLCSYAVLQYLQFFLYPEIM